MGTSGKVGARWRAADAERAQLAALQIRMGKQSRHEADIDVAGHDVGRERGRAPIRNLQQLDAGELRKQLCRDISDVADAGMAVAVLARIFSGERDKFRKRLGRKVRPRHQHDTVGLRQQRYRHEFGDRIVGRIGADRDVAGERTGRHQQRVAVGWRLCHECGADRAGRAAFVFDHDRLAERFRHFFRERPPDQIVGSASGKGNDEPDRALRIGLRHRGRRG